jgi:hypothetical protein
VVVAIDVSGSIGLLLLRHGGALARRRPAG